MLDCLRVLLDAGEIFLPQDLEIREMGVELCGCLEGGNR